jgi:hypothetical protein
MDQARPFALVEPHAGFTLTSRHRHDTLATALWPMLSGQIAFGFSVYGRFRLAS